MKLTITRHGRTKENNAGILQGHLPGHLSEEGINQAKQVATRLKDEHFDLIISSDLARAADTAKEIATHHPDTPLTFTQEIRERNLGEFQGKRKVDLNWNTPETQEKFSNPETGESRKELLKRAKTFITKLIQTHINDSILLVCHQSIGQALISAILNKDIKEIFAGEKLRNTSISVFEIKENKAPRTILLNDTTHLN